MTQDGTTRQRLWKAEGAGEPTPVRIDDAEASKGRRTETKKILVEAAKTKATKTFTENQIETISTEHGLSFVGSQLWVTLTL